MALDRSPSCPTTPLTSRSSRASTPSASAPACTSVPPVSAGLHHLVHEVVDNSVDEAMAGHADHIAVTLQARRGVHGRRQRPRYPGRRCTRSSSKPAVEVVLTVLHAGGKFGGSGYAVSGGLHGVGVSVVNALSQSARGRGSPRWPRVAAGVRPRRPDRAAGEGRGHRHHRHHGDVLGRPRGLRINASTPSRRCRVDSRRWPSSTAASPSR